MSIPDDYIGDPGYPAPWTTSRPREGLRDTDQALIISLAPDVCRSPGTPIPYPVVDFCGHDENYTPSVRFTGQKAMVMRSNTSHVHGDEPGIGKGVVSNTVGGISEPITHAAQVRAEGSPVIRHLDRFHMNNRNTVGEALFIRDTATYPAPKDDDPLPGSIKLADASGGWAQFAQPQSAASRATAPAHRPGTAPARPGSPVGPRPPGQVIRPDIPQWKRPPPTLPKPEGLAPKMLRWGRWGARVGAVAGLLWPSPLGDGTLPVWMHDLRSPDPLRRRTAEEAQRRYRANPALRPDLEEWYADEVRGRPRPAQASSDDDANAGRQPLPDLGPSVRVDEDENRPRCRIAIIYFMPVSPTVDRDEFRRQLKLQEGALNGMTPSEMLGNRGAYLADPAGMRKLSEPLQEDTRAEYRLSKEDEYKRAYGPRWKAELDAHMTTVAALHNPDMIAGGAYTSVADPSIPLKNRIGGLNENSSMGSQWRGGRSQRLENHAREQQRNGCPSVQVILEVGVPPGR